MWCVILFGCGLVMCVCIGYYVWCVSLFVVSVDLLGLVMCWI